MHGTRNWGDTPFSTRCSRHPRQEELYLLGKKNSNKVKDPPTVLSFMLTAATFTQIRNRNYRLKMALRVLPLTSLAMKAYGLHLKCSTQHIHFGAVVSIQSTAALVCQKQINGPQLSMLN